MADVQKLAPAQQLAATNKLHFPNESAEYRQARNALLAEEIELRRHIERVAAQRRALPPGWGDCSGLGAGLREWSGSLFQSVRQ